MPASEPHQHQDSGAGAPDLATVHAFRADELGQKGARDRRNPLVQHRAQYEGPVHGPPYDSLRRRDPISPQAFRDTILTGARVGGADAQARGIVDAAVPGGEVLANAIARATAVAGKNRAIYGTLKRAMYGDVFALLDSGQV